jgi:CRISPR-associated protein Cas1
MIRRTLYFGSPAYLSTKDKQLVIERDPAPGEERESVMMVPIEDIGVVILDNPSITLTQPLLRELLEENTAVISCDESHMPAGLFLPLQGSTVQPERFKYQLRASQPLRKRLWQQTMVFKISNQASLLEQQGHPVENMRYWASCVKSGDPDNLEGRAAAYYWSKFFPVELNFRRDRFGAPPNNLLNYGYAILRAITAQSLVGSGMLPTLGIHHRNKYNAYPLADDIMEPYRPFVDEVVFAIVKNGEDFNELSKSIKAQILKIGTCDVWMSGKRRPLYVALQRTAASLAFCFLGERRRILYPDLGVPLLDPGA